MHYIQNSWFTHNWIWVFTFLVLSVTIVAYINNRKSLLRKSVATLSVLFVLAVGSSAFYVNAGNAILSPSMKMNETGPKSAEVENNSLFSTLSNAVISILKDKVSN